MSLTTGIWIELYSPVKSFFPGQSISGCVIIENERRAVETTGLKIQFDGKAKVNWSEQATRKDSSSSGRKIVSVFYTSEKIYFSTELILLGSPSGQRSLVIPRGRSCYQFEFPLLPDLPSSFVSRFGNVSYSMMANLSLPWNRSDVTCILPFTVNGVVDLNLEPKANLPSDIRKYKSLCCLCCTSGPIGFVFKLPRRGYVPGEVIEFMVELSNQSTQRIYGMKVILNQIVRYHAEGNSKVTVRPIRQVQGPEVNPGESEIWVEKLLKIPPVPPSWLATCKMIDVQYVLKLELALPNTSLILKEEIQILVGTIPLRDTFSNLSASTISLSGGMRLSDKSESKPSLMSSDPSIGMGEMETSWKQPGQGPRQARTRGLSVTSDHPSFSDYPDLPPPSYQTAVMLDKSPEEENRGFDSDGDEKSYDPEVNCNGNAMMLSQMSPSKSFVPQYVTYGSGGGDGGSGSVEIK